MNLDTLLQLFEKNNRVFSIADKLSFAQPQHLHLKGLYGSASQFVFSAIFNHDHCKQQNHLVVLNDAEQAAYFHNTVESITKALNLFYFPSSFKNRQNFKLLNSSHVMLRTEALTKFSAQRDFGRSGALITYPEALFEKVVISEKLAANIIYIKAGDELNVNGLMENLVNHGFTRSDFVYEPGQFALRGGILDIYSYGNEKPYRVELFGNDVDSIRIFDAETQLSERKLLQVSIIPNIETQFTNESKVSLLDFLPENTTVWLQDWDYINDNIEKQQEDLDAYLNYENDKALSYAAMNVHEKKRHDKEQDDEDTLHEKATVQKNDFVTGSEVLVMLEKKHCVEFGTKSSLVTKAVLK